MNQDPDYVYPKSAPSNVIVFYINIEDMNYEDVPNFLEKMKVSLAINWEGTETVYLPVRGQPTRVELLCLQPSHESMRY